MQAPPMFWAKSDAGGQPHSLIGHLLDTAAVAQLIWDEYCSPHFRHALNDAAEGRGRDLYVLLCAFHDLGKATPAFQIKGEVFLRDALSNLIAGGLDLSASAKKNRWPHGVAGAFIARQAFERHGVQGGDWTLPLIQGHHGKYHVVPKKLGLNSVAHGRSNWAIGQLGLADSVAERVGVQLDGWALRAPSRGIQLALGGFIVMADWIASSSEFPGLGLVEETWEAAQERAATAWRRLGLVGGWRPDGLLADVESFPARFGFAPRPLQRLAVAAAEQMPAPGLMIVEAPMGEGKTEAAEAAAEVLARRFGLQGVTFAMPTQGTTDAMYDRVREWAGSVDPEVPVSLLHGKAMLNEHWRELTENQRITAVDEDEYGLALEYGLDSELPPASSDPAPSQWLLGRHRGLLSPISVATVDQVLWAATRTKFVALRHAGLSGRVLIIDEVHSYDAYMSVFLEELLRWCARLRIPVILMSATLAQTVRNRLLSAWRGAAGLPVASAQVVAAYPSVLFASADGEVRVLGTEPYRSDLSVNVHVLPVPEPEDTAPIVKAVLSEVDEGGCALVIVNTVLRAQEIWSGIKAGGVPGMLIHGALTAHERAERTARAVELLSADAPRPSRFVIVATQIAEQSFDVDADILFTDLAPIDLLLQRIGRLHRHERPITDRPEHLRVPRVIVTGLDVSGQAPLWASGFAIYQSSLLLRAAAELLEPGNWAVPSSVPELVARSYDHDAWTGPSGWADAERAAREEAAASAEERRLVARTWRLDQDPEVERADLSRLHDGSGTASEESGRPVVRDGDDSVEVSLIRLTSRGYETLSGRPLGRQGERASDRELAREVLGDSVRLRWRSDLATLAPFPQWTGLPLLATMPVVVLDEGGAGIAGRRTVCYDPELGLTAR